jgi:hypothetical protein
MAREIHGEDILHPLKRRKLYVKAKGEMCCIAQKLPPAGSSKIANAFRLFSINLSTFLRSTFSDAIIPYIPSTPLVIIHESLVL